AFVFVQSIGSDHYPEFIETVTAMDEVLELHSITGDGSHVLKLRVRTTTALERLLARLQGIPGVRGTRTSLVLSTLKETSYLRAEPMTLVPPED
ncbi:MAG: Lrp/AsnC ligand binding domain-containing protein, partial [Bacteroidota bacterium]